MLETYFAAPKTLGRLRAGPSGAYLDGFAALLERDGYRAATAVRYLRAADTGEYLFQAARWLGWLPLAVAFLLLRERIASRSRRTVRG